MKLSIMLATAVTLMLATNAFATTEFSSPTQQQSTNYGAMAQNTTPPCPYKAEIGILENNKTAANLAWNQKYGDLIGQSEQSNR